MTAPAAAFGVDVVLVLLFAAVGRSSHAEAGGIAGLLGTAWPFLVGLVAGWALVRWRRADWPRAWHHAIPIWVATVVLGMLLLAVTGQGTAVSFVAVATLVLAAFLLGWRLVAGLVLRRRAA